MHAGALGQFGADLDQQLGLAARPQHALVDGDLELAEGRAAEDVGQRLAFDPALPRRPRSRRRPRASSSPALSTRELLGLDPQRVGDQHFGVGAGVLDPRRGDPLGRIVEHALTVRAEGPRSQCLQSPSLAVPLLVDRSKLLRKVDIVPESAQTAG